MKAARILFAISILLSPAARAAVDENVVYAMRGGLAMLMDVHYPERSNGFGIVFISGSGWHAPLTYDASPLKASGFARLYVPPLNSAGYTVFVVNHRAAPRYGYPMPLEDGQRAVRFVRRHADRYGIDRDRIGGVGGSSGGHLISMLGVLDGKGDSSDPDPVERESAKLQAVVARAAPTDLTQFKGRFSSAFRGVSDRNAPGPARWAGDAGASHLPEGLAVSVRLAGRPAVPAAARHRGRPRAVRPVGELCRPAGGGRGRGRTRQDRGRRARTIVSAAQQTRRIFSDAMVRFFDAELSKGRSLLQAASGGHRGRPRRRPERGLRHGLGRGSP